MLADKALHLAGRLFGGRPWVPPKLPTLDEVEEQARADSRDHGLTSEQRGRADQLACWLVELKNMRKLFVEDGLAASKNVPDEDRLACAWEDQQAFMSLLKERRDFPAFPVDISSREGQRIVKTIAQDAMGELFEAIQHLKNAKLHRATELAEFDRAAFVEELVDAFKLLLEVALLVGVGLDEFWESYRGKTAKNTVRILGGY